MKFLCQWVLMKPSMQKFISVNMIQVNCATLITIIIAMVLFTVFMTA